MSGPPSLRRRLDAIRRRATTSPDDGQVLLLSIGYVVLVLLLVTAVVSASAIHLERKRLLALADLTALAAAGAIDEQAYFTRTTGEELLVLGAAEVRAAAVDHLTRSAPDAARLTDLALVDATTDGSTVSVTLPSVARPALISWITAPWSDGIELAATTTARAG